ncbi:transferase, partial [Actinospica acidiphila]|nr:transferase [Actinospica acidiphila]
GTGAWDLRLSLRFRDGATRTVSAHALTGPGLLRPRAVPSPRHGLILVRPYATHGGALALRVAAGPQDAGRILTGRLRRRLP